MKVLIITSYPEKSKVHGSKTVGGAAYTKNLLFNLIKRSKNLKMEVLGEVLPGEEKSYVEKGIKVNRIWKRNSIFSLLNLVFYVLKHPANKVIISYEVYMFGAIYMNVLFIFMLFLWKLCGKRNIVILHQVVKEFKFFYFPIIWFSDKVIVFEYYFKKILNFNKVVFIPHAVENRKKSFKVKKGKFNALFFGFLSPYKGIEYLIDFWKREYGMLTIAGGLNPNHVKNKRYKKYVNLIFSQAKKKGIKVTGFIPESKIDFYFSKADLVIFPYKMFFSSSGPLSLAFSFAKPFILSRPLEKYFDSPDIRFALKEIGLSKEDFIFDFNQESFRKRLIWAKKHLKKMSEFSKAVKRKRDCEKVIMNFLEVIK